MAFTVTNVEALDGAGDAIGGGLLAADIAGGGVGPHFLFHGIVDGIAGSNRAEVDTGNRLKILNDNTFVDDAAFTPGTSRVGAFGFLVDDTGTDSADEGDIGIPRMSADRIQYVMGHIAHDAADGGNPITIGGRYVATTSAVADGDRTRAVTDSHGNLRVTLWNGNSASQIGTQTTALTGVTAASTGIIVSSRNYISNGTTLDVAVSGAGAVGAGVQRMTLGSNDPAVTALEIMDDWDEADRLKVNPIAGQAGVAAGAGAVDALTQRITHASNDPLLTAVQGVNHDEDASGVYPSMLGGYAVAHGSNPTGVSAANDAVRWRFSRAGIPFMVGGHPNIITHTATVTDANGAQTDLALVTVSAGTKIVVTRYNIKCSNANSVNVDAKFGFAAANLGSPSTTPAAGILEEFKAIPPGGGINVGNGGGILGIGGDGEDLRFTCTDPTGGHVSVTYSYYTIES